MWCRDRGMRYKQSQRSSNMKGVPEKLLKKKERDDKSEDEIGTCPLETPTTK